MAGDRLHFIGRATGFEQFDRGIFTQTVKAVSLVFVFFLCFLIILSGADGSH